MGTSTVSGPFRSANGFQELVNGQWVPVAGGGGGGGPVSVHALQIPTDGSTTTTTLPAPTQVGQVFWVFCQLPASLTSEPVGNMELLFTPTPTAEAVTYAGWMMEAGEVIQVTGDYTSEPPFMFGGPFPASIYQVQLTYMGLVDFGGNLVDYYSFSFWIFPTP